MSLDTTKTTRRVIKPSPDSSNFLVLEGGNSILASGPNAVGVTKNHGVFINGPTSFSSSMDNIKFGGMFRFNPLAASGLPSTMVTPIPTFIIDPPVKGVSTMAAVAGIFASLV